MRLSSEARFQCVEVDPQGNRHTCDVVAERTLRPQVHWRNVMEKGRNWRYFNVTLRTAMYRRSSTEYCDVRDPRRVFHCDDPAQPAFED